jgi:hypothetical protein
MNRIFELPPPPQPIVSSAAATINTTAHDDNTFQERFIRNAFQKEKF